MKKLSAPTAVPQLHVMFDSSSIYSGEAHYLVSQTVAETIAAQVGRSDLDVSWYLPAVVMEERRHKMLEKAASYLPTLERLRALLGHDLGITEQVLEDRVGGCIKNQLEQRQLTMIEVDPQIVDWGGLIQDAVRRRPPFSSDGTEKGFRDRIIAEAFMQQADIIKPSTKRRVAIVCADVLLRGYLEERTKSMLNVHVFADLDQLKGLINTIVSDADVTYIARLRERARTYYYVPGDVTTLHIRESVRRRLESECADRLRELPSGAVRRVNDSTWSIGPPEFQQKEGRRTKWSSKVTVKAKAFRFLDPEGVLPRVANVEGATGSDTMLASILREFVKRQGESSESRANEAAEEPFLEGRTILAVDWSVTVTTNGQFRAAKVDAVRFVETTWFATTASG